jgi:hypothetical protein
MWDTRTESRSSPKVNWVRSFDPIENPSKISQNSIVQFDWGDGHGISHTMVVSQKRTSDGMIYLSGHDDDHFLDPIYNILSEHPDAKVYAWKLRDEYFY